MRLYDYLPSGNGYKVRWTLARLGIACEYIALDIHKGETHTPEFLALNPAGQVPLLVLGNERPLAESNAIIGFLAEGSPLVPADPFFRAKMLQWMFWEQYRHEPAIAVARFIRAYAPERAEELPALHAKGLAALAVMDGHLLDRDWFVGGNCTLADIALYAYTHVAEEGGFDLAAFPAVTAWLARFAAQSGHVVMEWVPQA